MFDLYQKTTKVRELLGLESTIVLGLLIALAWSFYRVFLKEANKERHENIHLYFQEIFKNFAFFILVTLMTVGMDRSFQPDETFARPIPYLTLIAIVWGGFIFVRTCRLLLLQYLFLGSMKAGVPVLLVNIFSLILSIGLFIWLVSGVFQIQLAPLLATSAVFSIVLGLALQDTLGNLFAGISLQFDKAFEIGDWLEVNNGSQKTVGQVKEITWRSTTLIGWSDEVITIPNRVMSSSSLANYQNGEIPFLRSQIFRLSYDADEKLVKSILVGSLQGIKDIRDEPAPLCFVSESTDSWQTFKLVYYIERYGAQFVIADHVLHRGWNALKAAGLSPEKQSFIIHNPEA